MCLQNKPDQQQAHSSWEGGRRTWKIWLLKLGCKILGGREGGRERGRVVGKQVHATCVSTLEEVLDANALYLFQMPLRLSKLI